jgi:hypothetical protein
MRSEDIVGPQILYQKGWSSLRQSRRKRLSAWITVLGMDGHPHGAGAAVIPCIPFHREPLSEQGKVPRLPTGGHSRLRRQLSVRC